MASIVVSTCDGIAVTLRPPVIDDVTTSEFVVDVVDGLSLSTLTSTSFETKGGASNMGCT